VGSSAKPTYAQDRRNGVGEGFYGSCACFVRVLAVCVKRRTCVRLVSVQLLVYVPCEIYLFWCLEMIVRGFRVGGVGTTESLQ